MAAATVTLNKWGNSQGIYLPSSICKALNLKIGDKIRVIAENDRAVLQPERAYTLDSLMSGYDGPKPQEYDWGAPIGKELW